MASINLLPWREARKRERNRSTLVICIAMWIIAGFLVFLGSSIMNARISHQEDRNAFLQQEINSLAKVIREIEDLKGKRDALLARMEVIQNLQRNRAQIVHVFDDLVHKLPKGVYYDRIVKKSGRLNIEGIAQSNGRVSALMRNLDASEWFDNASLNVVDVIDDKNLLVSKFDVEVVEEVQTNEDEGL